MLARTKCVPCSLALGLICKSANVSHVISDVLIAKPTDFRRDIIILKKHHPLKKTKVAYVDMWTRQAALRACYVTGHIFGLMVDISLAEEETS